MCPMNPGSDLFQFWLTVVKVVVRELALPADKGSPGERAEQNAGVARFPTQGTQKQAERTVIDSTRL